MASTSANQPAEHMVLSVVSGKAAADEAAAAGEAASSVMSSTEGRSVDARAPPAVKISLKAQSSDARERAAISIQMRDPELVLDKVLELLANRFPVQAFYKVLANQQNVVREVAAAATSPVAASRSFSSKVNSAMYHELVRLSEDEQSPINSLNSATMKSWLKDTLASLSAGELEEVITSVSPTNSSRLAHVLLQRAQEQSPLLTPVNEPVARHASSSLITQDESTAVSQPGTALDTGAGSSTTQAVKVVRSRELIEAGLAAGQAPPAAVKQSFIAVRRISETFEHDAHSDDPKPDDADSAGKWETIDDSLLLADRETEHSNGAMSQSSNFSNAPPNEADQRGTALNLWSADVVDQVMQLSLDELVILSQGQSLNSQLSELTRDEKFSAWLDSLISIRKRVVSVAPAADSTRPLALQSTTKISRPVVRTKNSFLTMQPGVAGVRSVPADETSPKAAVAADFHESTASGFAAMQEASRSRDELPNVSSPRANLGAQTHEERILLSESTGGHSSLNELPMVQSLVGSTVGRPAAASQHLLGAAPPKGPYADVTASSLITTPQREPAYTAAATVQPQRGPTNSTCDSAVRVPEPTESTSQSAHKLLTTVTSTSAAQGAVVSSHSQVISQERSIVVEAPQIARVPLYPVHEHQQVIRQRSVTSATPESPAHQRILIGAEGHVRSASTVLDMQAAQVAQAREHERHHSQSSSNYCFTEQRVVHLGGSVAHPGVQLDEVAVGHQSRLMWLTMMERALDCERSRIESKCRETVSNLLALLRVPQPGVGSIDAEAAARLIHQHPQVCSRIVKSVKYTVFKAFRELCEELGFAPGESWPECERQELLSAEEEARIFTNGNALVGRFFAETAVRMAIHTCAAFLANVKTRQPASEELQRILCVPTEVPERQRSANLMEVIEMRRQTTLSNSLNNVIEPYEWEPLSGKELLAFVESFFLPRGREVSGESIKELPVARAPTVVPRFSATHAALEPARSPESTLSSEVGRPGAITRVITHNPAGAVAYTASTSTVCAQPEVARSAEYQYSRATSYAAPIVSSPIDRPAYARGETSTTYFPRNQRAVLSPSAFPQQQLPQMQQMAGATSMTTTGYSLRAAQPSSHVRSPAVTANVAQPVLYAAPPPLTTTHLMTSVMTGKRADRADDMRTTPAATSPFQPSFGARVESPLAALEKQHSKSFLSQLHKQTTSQM